MVGEWNFGFQEILKNLVLNGVGTLRVSIITNDLSKSIEKKGIFGSHADLGKKLIDMNPGVNSFIEFVDGFAFGDLDVSEYNHVIFVSEKFDNAITLDLNCRKQSVNLTWVFGNDLEMFFLNDFGKHAFSFRAIEYSIWRSY